MNIELTVLEESFAICQINCEDTTIINSFIKEGVTFFLAQTADELSLVCPESKVPKDYLQCDKSWCTFKITGILDFSLIGILSKISVVLAANNIGIFVVSTFNTDYILVKESARDAAITALKNNGYRFI